MQEWGGKVQRACAKGRVRQEKAQTAKGHERREGGKRGREEKGARKKKWRLGGANKTAQGANFQQEEVLFKQKTNLQNKGLISVDRGTRASLIRTIPRSLFKSYTKDLSFPIFELVLQHRLKLLLWSHSAVTML